MSEQFFIGGYHVTRTLNYSVERLMCEVEFFGRCVFLGKVHDFFNVVSEPTT